MSTREKLLVQVSLMEAFDDPRRAREMRDHEEFVGETRMFARSRWGAGPMVVHADKHCRHLPDGPLRVYPASFVDQATWLDRCKDCTVQV